MASAREISPLYLTSLMLGQASDPIFAVYILNPASSWAWSLEASNYLKILKLRNILLNLPNILAHLGGPLLKDPSVKYKDAFVAESVIGPLCSETAAIGQFLSEGCEIPFPHKFSRRARDSFVSYEFPSGKVVTANSDEFVERCALFKDGFDDPEESASSSVLRLSRQLKHITRYAVSIPSSTNSAAVTQLLDTADKILRMILIFETVGLQLKIADAHEMANVSSDDSEDDEDEYSGEDEDEKNYKGTSAPQKRTPWNIPEAYRERIAQSMKERQLRADYEERLELNEALQQQRRDRAKKRQKTQ